MNSDDRRKEIIRMLVEKKEPISGLEFANSFGVTRQIIVKDISLIKAGGYKVVSTARGYTLDDTVEKSNKISIRVCHTAHDIEKELQIIVDNGGQVITTGIEHPYYGELGEELNIRCRKDIVKFMQKLNETGSEPLLCLTKGVHHHIIQADDEETLREIYTELKANGYIVADEEIPSF